MDEILNIIESVSGGFLSYSLIVVIESVSEGFPSYTVKSQFSSKTSRGEKRQHKKTSSKASSVTTS